MTTRSASRTDCRNGRTRGQRRLVLTLLLTLLLTACSSGIVIPPTPTPSVPAGTASPAAASPTVGSPVAASPTAVRTTASPPAGSPGAVISSPSPKPSGPVVVPVQPVAVASRGPGQLVGPIKIVSSLPRTGPAKAQTDSIVFAIKLALEEVGSRVDGANIVYEDWDDATPERNAWDPDKVAENANKAVADPDVMVFLGPYTSGAARIAIPILNQADLVAISPSATYTGLTRPGGAENEPDIYYPNGKRNFARVIPPDDLQGTLAASWAKSLGANKVYVLYDTERYGQTLANAFAEEAGRLGMQLIGPPEAVDPRAPDFFGIAGKVKSASPDLVYYGGLTENSAGRLFTELRAQLGPGVKLMGPDGLYQQTFLDAAGDAAEGILVTFTAVAPSKLTGRGGEWYRGFKVRTGAEPEAYAAYAYEATRVTLDAIRRAGRKDRAAIRDAVLATRDFDGILGRWSFDANGDTTLRMVSGREVKGGTFDDAGAVTLRGDGP